MPQAISKFTMVNADTTAKENSEQSERMRHLVVKSVLSDSEGEAAETQTSQDFAHDCGYINLEICSKYNQEYEHVPGMIVNMIKSPGKWSI